MKNFRLTPLGKIMLLLLMLMLLSGFKHLSKIVLEDSKKDNNNWYDRSQNRRVDISFILSEKGGEYK